MVSTGVKIIICKLSQKLYCVTLFVLSCTCDQSSYVLCTTASEKQEHLLICVLEHKARRITAMIVYEPVWCWNETGLSNINASIFEEAHVLLRWCAVHVTNWANPFSYKIFVIFSYHSLGFVYSLLCQFLSTNNLLRIATSFIVWINEICKIPL